jgi:hypothetical protein
MKAKIFATVVALTLTLLSYQNCGGGFQNFEGQTGSTGVLKVDGLSNVVARGSTFRVMFNTSLVPAGSEVLWDQHFGDGSTYCLQTTSPNKAVTDFYCPELGTQQVIVEVIHPDGTRESHVTEVIVGEATRGPVGNGPGGDDPSGPGEPMLTQGQQLYQTNCATCHGNVAPQNVSAKKGRSAAQIQTAINTRPIMQNLNFLSAQEVQMIAEALQ